MAREAIKPLLHPEAERERERGELLFLSPIRQKATLFTICLLLLMSLPLFVWQRGTAVSFFHESVATVQLFFHHELAERESESFVSHPVIRMGKTALNLILK